MARIVQFVLTHDIGGLERMVVDLALQQKKAGHDVRIYCLFHLGPVTVAAFESGIPIVEFQEQGRSTVWKIVSLVKAMVRDRPDVVHSHNPTVHPYAALAAKITRVPVVVNTRHGIQSHLGGPPYTERKFKLVYGLTDRVVFISDDTRDFYVNELGLYKSNSVVTVNGIFTQAYRAHSAEPEASFLEFDLARWGGLSRSKRTMCS